MIAAPQTGLYFRRLQERIVEFVSGHSGIRPERFEELMLQKDDMAADVGSILYGKEAVEEGLIDRLGGLSDALEYLYKKIRREKKGKRSAD